MRPAAPGGADAGFISGVAGIADDLIEEEVVPWAGALTGCRYG